MRTYTLCDSAAAYLQNLKLVKRKPLQKGCIVERFILLDLCIDQLLEDRVFLLNVETPQSGILDLQTLKLWEYSVVDV